MCLRPRHTIINPQQLVPLLMKFKSPLIFVNSNPIQARCIRYNIMCSSLSVPVLDTTLCVQVCQCLYSYNIMCSSLSVPVLDTTLCVQVCQCLYSIQHYVFKFVSACTRYNIMCSSLSAPVLDTTLCVQVCQCLYSIQHYVFKFVSACTRYNIMCSSLSVPVLDTTLCVQVCILWKCIENNHLKCTKIKKIQIRFLLKLFDELTLLDEYH